MAQSPVPLSPLGGPYRSYANRSPSPPAQPMSKKDKRKSQHVAQLQELQDDFQYNRESQFRKQLVTLQQDMNMITHSDPYLPETIDDTPEEVSRFAEQAASGTPYQSEISQSAGRWYADFVREINAAKEAKELALSNITHVHEQKLDRLKYECDFRLHLASEECEHMTSTLRERLTQQLTSKRQRLLKEKEQLDIADTNALLLHPSQFTITNPATPAGQPSRKTRTTRRGEQDDLNGFHDVGNKRKRKLVGDDDTGSPSRNGTSTPAGRRGADALAHQTAPLYSISTLFTEKELNFQSHQAQIAARHFFATSHKDGETNSRNKRRKDDGDAKSASSDNDSGEDEDELEAPGMERTASQQIVHATRSTRNIGVLSGLNILSEMAEKASTRPALPYATLHTHQAKSGTFLPQASRLLDSEIEEDLTKIIQIESQSTDQLDKKAVDEALAPLSKNRSKLAPDWPVYMDMHLQEIDPRAA